MKISDITTEYVREGNEKEKRSCDKMILMYSGCGVVVDN